MSVRNAILALLQGGPTYGYQLKKAFETSTDGVWPLNVGQVYQVLSRLERDGLVEQIAPAIADEGAQQAYRITPAGRGEAARWFSSPVDRGTPPRDELVVKIMLAVSGFGGDVTEVIQRQRNAAIRALQDYTRLKAEADAAAELRWLMVLDSMILQAEAEVRWLDLVEARIARGGLRGREWRDHAPAAIAADERAAAARPADATPSGVEPAPRRERTNR